MRKKAEKLDDYSIHKKLRILYIFCVLLPLILTDSVILATAVRADWASANYELEQIADAVGYHLTSLTERAATAANYIYTNSDVNDFLEKKYTSVLDYYIDYQRFQKNALLESTSRISGHEVFLYADNDTIINGGGFARLDSARDAEWYRYLTESGQEMALYIYYEYDKPAILAQRRISLIRKLNYYKRDNCEKILKLDIDYGRMVRDLVNMNYEVPVYICLDNRILCSNCGYSGLKQNFDTFEEGDKVGYKKEINLCGQKLDICVLKKDADILSIIRNNFPLILFLITINAILPDLFMKVINRSFTARLEELSAVFNHMEGEYLQEIPNVRGKDELGALMKNYNRMAARNNAMIQNVYIDKLKKQELEIARQKAELLALYSQINPHFMMNALESIRMHSILKNESETADMVERLALMERQYMDWSTDMVSIKEEMMFVDSYLKLQKYRFGERLSFQLDVDTDCQEEYIPKLTLVTFVENACVHGIESKSSPGWIFVRVTKCGGVLQLEIEDTGNGIQEPMLSELREKMAHGTIDMLKQKGSVGVLNACLRLRMMTESEVRFELESEDKIGTTVTIKIPVNERRKEHDSRTTGG